MVEEDHAVRYVLFQPMARQCSGAPLASNDCGDAFFFEPAKQPAQLVSQNEGIGECGKDRLNGIDGDPFCADGVDRMTEAQEQTLEIVFAGFFDLASF